MEDVELYQSNSEARSSEPSEVGFLSATSSYFTLGDSNISVAVRVQAFCKMCSLLKIPKKTIDYYFLFCL